MATTLDIVNLALKGVAALLLLSLFIYKVVQTYRESKKYGP